MKFVLLVIVTLWSFEFGISLPHDPDHLEESDDDCSRLCSDNFDPVCGSTGRTYPNECHFDCAAQRRKDLTKVDDGPCPKELAHHASGITHCHCRKNIEPVCGTNGVTYRNLCLLRCAHQKERHIRLRSNTACDAPPEDVQEPVSHSRSLTDTTPQDSSTTPAREEEEECVCPRIYTPVCGTNGVKYSNMCELRCVMAKNSTVTLAYKGRCKPKVVEKAARSHSDQKILPINANGECVCESEGGIPIKQVCGSNGVTYQNECEFNCAEYREPTLYAVNEGICQIRKNSESEEVEVQKNPIGPEACKCTPSDLPSSDNEPVCSGDNITYLSKCALLCEKKKYPSVRLSFCGPCSKTHRCKRGGGKKVKARMEAD